MKVLFPSSSQGIPVNSFGYQLYTYNSNMYSNSHSLTLEFLTPISSRSVDTDTGHKLEKLRPEMRQNKRMALGGFRVLIHEIPGAPSPAPFVRGNLDHKYTQCSGDWHTISKYNGENTMAETLFSEECCLLVNSNANVSLKGHQAGCRVLRGKRIKFPFCVILEKKATS